MALINFNIYQLM